MYLDTDVFLAAIKPKDWLNEFAKQLQKVPETKYTSALTLIEIELVLIREPHFGDAFEIPALIRNAFPEIQVKTLDEIVFKNSLDLRRKYGLTTFDAIHAATAQAHDSRIASSDGQYDRIPGLTRIGPKERAGQ